MSKTYFNNKLISYNRKITSNKTKYLKVQKKLHSLITKEYKFFQAGFILQVMINLKTRLFIIQHLKRKNLKEDKGTDYVFSWK